MAALRCLCALLVVSLTVPAQARSDQAWEPQIAQAARRSGIPADWIRRVMRAESGGRTQIGGRPVRSRAGAMGLMQLMPATWAAMRDRLGLGGDPDDPGDNILAGAFYLRLLYDRFGYPGCLAAYNAGPARYEDYLSGRRALPAETLAYVSSLVPDADRRMAGPAGPVSGGDLFAGQAQVPADVPRGPGPAPENSLFAIRKGDK